MGNGENAKCCSNSSEIEVQHHSAEDLVGIVFFRKLKGSERPMGLGLSIIWFSIMALFEGPGSNAIERTN